MGGGGGMQGKSQRARGCYGDGSFKTRGGGGERWWPNPFVNSLGLWPGSLPRGSVTLVPSGWGGGGTERSEWGRDTGRQRHSLGRKGAKRDQGKDAAPGHGWGSGRGVLRGLWAPREPSGMAMSPEHLDWGPPVPGPEAEPSWVPQTSTTVMREAQPHPGRGLLWPCPRHSGSAAPCVPGSGRRPHVWKGRCGGWKRISNLRDLAASFTALLSAAPLCPSPFCYPLQAWGPGPLAAQPNPLPPCPLPPGRPVSTAP